MNQELFNEMKDALEQVVKSYEACGEIELPYQRAKDVLAKVNKGHRADK